MNRKINYLIFILFSCIHCSVNEDYTEQKPSPTITQRHTIDPRAEILFVGNSLTYFNDMPKMVEKLALSFGDTIRTATLALPNYALVDHLADGQIQNIIPNYKFKFVVVQQGPSSQAEGRQLLLEAAPILKKLCEDHGAKLAFFMVWPAHANFWTFDGVIKNYTDAAIISNSILCPVGKVWKEYIDTTGDLSYYGSDLFHPSAKGSQIAAEIIYKSLYN